MESDFEIEFLKSTFEIGHPRGWLFYFLQFEHSAFSTQHSAKANPCLNHRQSADANRKQLAISHWQLAFVFWLRPD